MFDRMRIPRMTREVMDLTVYLIIACHVVLKRGRIYDWYETITIPTLLAAVLCPRSTRDYPAGLPQRTCRAKPFRSLHYLR